MKRLSADRSNSYRMMGPSKVVPYNDLEPLLQTITEQTAAEPQI